MIESRMMGHRKQGVIRLLGILFAVVSILIVIGCKQGAVSEKPPIHFNPNMDSQERYDAQAASRFFADGMVNRMPVKGTVALSEGYEDTEFYFGKTADGKVLKKAPVPFTAEVLKRGQKRFNIYCAPCHGRTGNAKGIVVNRGFLPPPDFHTDKVRNYPDGHIFDVISNGFRNMPSYKHQIPVADRWKIVAYVRALQRSQNASAQDVPEEKRAKLALEK